MNTTKDKVLGIITDISVKRLELLDIENDIIEITERMSNIERNIATRIHLTEEGKQYKNAEQRKLAIENELNMNKDYLLLKEQKKELQQKKDKLKIEIDKLKMLYELYVNLFKKEVS